MNQTASRFLAGVAAVAIIAAVCPDAKAEGPKALAAARFPLRVAANQRHLVDAQGEPFLIHGDTAWMLIVQLTKEEVESYLEDRRRKGFNAVNVMLISKTWADKAPRNIYGQEPFTAPGDFSAPNDAYFEHAAWVLKKAADKGFLVFLVPAWHGHNDKQGWAPEVVKNGPENCRRFGRYLGSRYKDFTNVIWLDGGDRAPAPGSALETSAMELLLGIEEMAPSQLHTAHWNRKTTAREVPAFELHLDLDLLYAKYRPYVQGLRRYAVADPRPTFLIECSYEGEGSLGFPVAWTPREIRRQAYWTVLSGATGHFYGNAGIQNFGWDGEPKPVNREWRPHLDDPGTLDMEHLQAFFRRHRWHELVPDAGHRVVTSGYGTPDEVDDQNSRKGYDYVTAARTPDGKVVVAYVPPTGVARRTLTVDMTKLAGPTTARWFNPNDGQYRVIAADPLPNAGSRRFTTPGDNGDGTNDWLLVLEVTPAPAP
ncbi:MAG: glycoside hydrolase family 140 protein [Acidobacteria bacterium]|nr:glycoside hydrolase family 140 protein [Acidobacteriota bacterium]